MIVHRSRALLLEPFELILIFADIRDRHFPWVIYVSAQQATRVRVVTITLRVAGQRRALRRGCLRSSRLLIVIVAPEITSAPGFLDDGFVCARDLCHSVGVETAERLDSGCSETTFRFLPPIRLFSCRGNREGCHICLEERPPCLSGPVYLFPLARMLAPPCTRCIVLWFKLLSVLGGCNARVRGPAGSKASIYRFWSPIERLCGVDCQAPHDRYLRDVEGEESTNLELDG